MKYRKGTTPLIIILLLLGGVFSTLYANSTGTLSLNTPNNAPDMSRIINQKIDNEKIGPHDNYPSMGNVVGGTTGEIENGNVFIIWPRPEYNNGLWIQLEIVNRNELNKKYSSFTENFALYQSTTDNSANWENNQNWKTIPKENGLITLIGSPLTFQVKKEYVDNNYPIVVALENGEYQAKENYDSYPGPIHFLDIDKGAY